MGHHRPSRKQTNSSTHPFNPSHHVITIQLKERVFPAGNGGKSRKKMTREGEAVKASSK